jgi:ATP synthase protein I
MAIVENSLAAGRRLAMQVVLIQAAVAVCAGLAFLVQGVPSALGAFAGGLVVVVGTGLLALRVFAQTLAGPGAMVARFALGTLLKWIVVIVGFYLIVAYWKLPPLPAVIGLAAAVLVNLVVLGFKR